MPALAPPYTEEFLQHRPGGGGVAQARDAGAVVAGGLLEEARAVQHGAALGILGGEHHAADPRQADGAGAHGAGLQADEQRGAEQPLIVQPGGGGADRQELGMGGGIAPLDDAVAVPGQDLAVRRQQHGADRHLAPERGGLGFFERECYGFVVVHHLGPILAKTSTWSPRTDAERTESIEAEKPGGERVAKAMARAGVCSRRDAEKMIAEGRVAVDGEVLTSPARNVTDDNVITVDGKPIAAKEQTRLWRYHKPGGMVTTHKDPLGRPTVFINLPRSLPRVVSVGRLDYNSEGLLLLTNDGEMARRLELPASGWTRTYRARLFGKVTQAELEKLATGLTIDGVKYGPIIADLERVKGMYAWVSVKLTEGKNREVKRVMERLGFKVARLIRVQYGPFHLGQLPEGGVEEIPTKLWREQLGIGRKKR